jgi:transcriptional regulator GlxA family with amidase domain
MSLNEYIYSLRIKKANYLMKQGCSITEAALCSGFQSVRTFNNTYKKITGIVPSEYRKKQMDRQ